MNSISAQVSDASSLLGILLILVTLFTQILASALDDQSDLTGGAEKETRNRIRVKTSGLFIFTLLVILSLTPTIHNVFKSHGTQNWESPFFLFILVWFALFPLCAWHLLMIIELSKLKVNSGKK